MDKFFDYGKKDEETEEDVETAPALESTVIQDPEDSPRPSEDPPSPAPEPIDSTPKPGVPPGFRAMDINEDGDPVLRIKGRTFVILNTREILD